MPKKPQKTTKPKRAIETYKQPSYVSGLSVSDILHLKDYESLTDKQIRQITTRVVSAGNKRIKRLEKAYDHPVAVEQLTRNGGAFFSVKGKSRSELITELTRAKEFFETPFSTVKGTKKVTRDTLKYLRENEMLRLWGTQKQQEEKIAMMWSIFNKQKEIDPTLNNIYYNEALNLVQDEIENGGTYDEIYDRIESTLRKKYEKRTETQDVGTGGYF